MFPFDSLLSFLPLPFSFPFPFLPFLPFPIVPFTCPMSIGADVSGVVCRPRSSQVLGASGHSSHVSTQGLVRLTICQRNHFQEITVGCCRVFHHRRYLDRSAPAAILHCATSFSQEASMSPWSRPSLCIFFHLARGLRIPLKSAAVRFPPLPSRSSSSFQSKASENQGYQRKSFAHALRDERGILFSLSWHCSRPDHHA